MKIHSLQPCNDEDRSVAYQLIASMPTGNGSGHDHHFYLDANGAVLRVETILQCRWQPVRKTLVQFWSTKYAKQIAEAFAKREA